MPRDSSGNYTLYSPGNPVVSGTLIEAAWANNTMDDVAQAITDSLDRNGRGGMNVPFKFADGSVGAPSITWESEPASGWYRAAAGDFRYAIGGIDVMRINSGVVSVWANGQWNTLIYQEFPVGINTQTGTAYEPVLADQGRLIILNNAASITVTIPDNATTAFPIGTRLEFGQYGPGQVAFVAGGSTVINSKGGAGNLSEQFSGATLTKTDTDTWWLVGDIA